MEVRLVAVLRDSGTEPLRVIVKTCNWGYGGALEAPRGLGPSPRSQPFLRWKTLQNYAETDPDPAFIFSMCRTTAHSLENMTMMAKYIILICYSCTLKTHGNYNNQLYFSIVLLCKLC